jgi:chloramphenicol-sensitive protein RarD
MPPLSSTRGIIYALAAFLSWGLLPVYWKAIKTVPAFETLCHRIVWSAVLITLLMVFKKRLSVLKSSLGSLKMVGLQLVAGLLIGLNWYTYIWAMNNNQVVEASLGYYICPLSTIFLGTVFLRERLSVLQWVSVLLAFSGVFILTLHYGVMPWVAISLAFTFSLYGLLKKKTPFDAISGLGIEMSLLFLPALFFLGFFEYQGSSAFFHWGPYTTLFLIFTGLITFAPLYWFAESAKRIDLSTIGFIQYVAPTCQLLLGIFVYQEAFSRTHLITFSLIWIALALFSLEGIRKRHSS